MKSSTKKLQDARSLKQVNVTLRNLFAWSHFIFVLQSKVTQKQHLYSALSGMDAKTLAIVDVTWPSAESTKPEVNITLNDIRSYRSDPVVAKSVEQHNRIVKELVSLQSVSISQSSSSC